MTQAATAIRPRTPRPEDESLLGIGLYTIAEASRLTGVSAGRIRRWIAGYKYLYRDEVRKRPPVWRGQLPIVMGRTAVGFLDLIEVQFVNALREKGASWKTIRLAAETAREIYRSDHPFATKGFLIRTDGKKILGYLLSGESDTPLMDLATNEFVMEKLVSPSLVHAIDFDEKQALRWWPMGRDKKVMIDPRRSFGQPVVIEKGIPTVVLFDAYNAEKS